MNQAFILCKNRIKILAIKIDILLAKLNICIEMMFYSYRKYIVKLYPLRKF
jgi:hypothetical protein